MQNRPNLGVGQSPAMNNFALALLLLTLANTASSATLCEPGEVVLFNCNAATKTVSLCRSSDLSETVGYMQYRYGPPGRPEMVFPKTKKHPSRYFSVSYVPGRSYYSSVSFEVGKFKYEVYSLQALPDPVDPNNNGSGEECDLRHGVWVTSAKGRYDVRCNCSDEQIVDGLHEFFDQREVFGVSTSWP